MLICAVGMVTQTRRRAPACTHARVHAHARTKSVVCALRDSLVDDGTTSCVDQVRGWFHALQRCSIDQVLGAVC